MQARWARQMNASDNTRHPSESWGLKVRAHKMPPCAGMTATMKSVGIFDKWGVWLTSLHH